MTSRESAFREPEEATGGHRALQSVRFGKAETSCRNARSIAKLRHVRGLAEASQAFAAGLLAARHHRGQENKLSLAPRAGERVGSVCTSVQNRDSTIGEQQMDQLCQGACTMQTLRTRVTHVPTCHVMSCCLIARTTRMQATLTVAHARAVMHAQLAAQISSNITTS